MKAKDFRQEQDYPYNHFTKLTSTGISADYDHIEAFAEAYHESKVKNLGLFSVSQQRELLLAFRKTIKRPKGFEITDYDIEKFIKANNCG